MLGLSDYTQTCWLDFLSDLEDSVLLCDTAALELAHWSITVPRLVGQHRVVGVHHTSDPVVEYQTSSIFLLVGDIDTLSSVSTIIERWIDSSTQFVTAISLLSLASLRVISGKDNPDCYYLDVLSRLNTIYPNVIFNFTISPLSCFTYTDNTFITPASRRLFPLSEPDLATLTTWLKSRGDGRSPELGQVITMAMLPRTLQLQVKVMAEELGCLFDQLGVVEDCYSVGSFARIVANQVVATVGHRPARKQAAKKLSVVFVDRTLDVFSATSFDRSNTASLVHNNSPELFADSNDIKIDLKRLFNKSETEFVLNGCLADSKSAIPIATLLTTDHVTLADDVLSSLEGQLQLDPETLTSRDLSVILPEADTFSKYQNFIHFQVLAAILGCLERADSDVTSYFSTTDTSLLWTTLEDSVLVCQLANSILASCQGDDNLSPLHIVTLLAHLYTLYGEMADCRSDTEDIERAKLKNTFFKRLKCSTDNFTKTLTSSCHSDDDLYSRVDDVFVRLESLSRERCTLSQLSTLTNKDSGSPSYTSLLEQVLSLCLDSTEDLVDMEYRSGGLRDLLKTGLGLFTRAVAKPRPAGPVLVYVVGGVSVGEVGFVEEYRQKTGREVYLASNCVLNHRKLANRVLINDNVFGL